MAFRVIMIENEVDIHIKLNQLVIRKEGKETWVPLDDISMIVMDNLSSKVTVRTLCQLSEQGIGMIVCNQQHLPSGYYGAYILESIRRYFSSYKYAEKENRWRDNVFIDGKNPGRKYFSIISISSKADLLRCINLSKQSLLVEYLKELLQDFDLQKQLEQLEITVAQMFLQLNEELRQMGQISLNYEMSEVSFLFSVSLEGYPVVEKDSIEGITVFGEDLFQMPNAERLSNFLEQSYPY